MHDQPSFEQQPPQLRRCAACGSPVDEAARHCSSCGAPTDYAAPDVNIEGWIRAGWDLFVKNPAAAILIPLVMMAPAALLGIFGYLSFLAAIFGGLGMRSHANWAVIAAAGSIFGLLYLALALIMPALSAGIYACFLAGIRTGRLTAAHLGEGFRNWWACTWVVWVLVLAELICLPFVLILVGIPAIVGVVSLMWLSLLRIGDKGRGGAEALSFAWNVMRGRLWMMLLFTFLAFLLQSLGAIALCVGMLVTTPIMLGALAAGYNALSKQEGPPAP
jgi:hypothetical protein